jgi:SAM-dependent methyltransferase
MSVTDGIEVVELTDEQPAAAWRTFRDSGMERLIEAMNLCHALAGLANSGMGARLRERGWVPRAAVLDGFVPHFADPFLRYLGLHGIVEGHDPVRLTDHGNALLSDISLAQLGFYHAAYTPVLQKITGLLTGTEVYGHTVQRDGAALGVHCATITRTFFTPIVLTAVERAGASHLLDLGCGAGQMVIDACLRQPGLRGTGLDISAEAIAVAKEAAVRDRVEDRTEFVVGDAFQPDAWPASCRKADAVTAVGVLHEHFRAGEQAVIDILNTYAVLFERGLKSFVLGEPEIVYEADNNDSDLFLVHIFTEQGMPRRRELWLDVIERSKLRCRRVFRRPECVPRFAFYDLVLA